MKTKCEQVPVPVDKCLTVKTTKCRKIKKKFQWKKFFMKKRFVRCRKSRKKLVWCLVLKRSRFRVRGSSIRSVRRWLTRWSG